MSGVIASLSHQIQKRPLPFIGIVLGNVIPLIGVLYWGWSLFEIFYLYWAENIIIGLFTFVRILMAGAREGVGGVFAGLFMCAFFTVHYGMFCMGHGMIMTSIFYPGELPFDLTEKTLFMLPWLLNLGGFIWALAGVVLVEAIYHFGLIFGPRARNDNIGMAMFAPYGRIVILHLTIILGGGLSFVFGFPPAALIFLIVLKVFYDLGLYGRQRHVKERLPDAVE